MSFTQNCFPFLSSPNLHHANEKWSGWRIKEPLLANDSYYYTKMSVFLVIILLYFLTQQFSRLYKVIVFSFCLIKISFILHPMQKHQKNSGSIAEWWKLRTSMASSLPFSLFPKIPSMQHQSILEQTLGDSGRQRNLKSCNPQGHKESVRHDLMTEPQQRDKS